MHALSTEISASSVNTIAVADVEFGSESGSYNWASLRSAARTAAMAEQLIGITHCRASTQHLLIAHGRASIILAPAEGLYEVTQVDSKMCEVIDALQGALDAREQEICSVDGPQTDASGEIDPKAEDHEHDRRSPGGRTFRECALVVSAMLAGKRTRAVTLILPTGDAITLHVAPKVRLLSEPARPFVHSDAKAEERVRAVQRLCHIMTVSGRDMLMESDMVHPAGSQIRIPASMTKLKRILVYLAGDVGREAPK